jgi:hypothetical protein|tara:strand:+ start:542 stop:643 length:102 start_codon:yes stop_codon:yes gene_type:complete
MGEIDFLADLPVDLDFVDLFLNVPSPPPFYEPA